MDLTKENELKIEMEDEVASQNKLLSAFCYFSVFFCSFLFPLIVFFVSDEEYTKGHAKKALLSQGIPYIVLIGFMLFSFTSSPLVMTDPGMAIFSVMLWYVVLLVLIFVIVVWNIIMGIKVLK